MPIANYAYETDPEDFYMLNPDTGNWDIEVKLETGYPAGTAVLKRRAKWVTQFGNETTPEESVPGYQMVQASPDTIAVYLGEFEHTLAAIYQQWVHAEVWNETHQYWERPQPTTKYSQEIYDLDNPTRLIGVEYVADFTLGYQLRTIINYNWFTGQVNKHTYVFHAPGVRKRIYTQLQIYQPDRFHMDLSDFEGPYEVIEQAGLTNVIYYPDGITDDICEVDPYLGVDEPTNYIRVTGDGFRVQFRTDFSYITENTHIIPLDSTTSWLGFRTRIASGGTSYNSEFDNNRKYIVLERGPNRVVVRKVGNFDGSNSPTENYLIECDGYVIDTYIYDDLVVYDVKFTMNSPLTTDDDNNYADLFGDSPSNLTNPQNMVESSGSEQDVGPWSGQYNTNDYVGIRSDEVIFSSSMLINNIGTLRRESAWAGTWVLAVRDNLVAQDYRFTISLNIDVYANPASRRLTLGNQQIDHNLTNLEDIVSELRTHPVSINSGGRASDITWHSDPNTDGKTLVTYDIDRIKPKHVLRDFPINTGVISSPVEHLIGHWKCDDNAADTVVLATVGNNGVLQGGNTTDSLSNLDAIRNRSLLTDGISDYVEASVVLSDPNKFTLMFKLKPNWSYTESKNQLIGLEGSGANYARFYYESAFNRYRWRIIAGGASIYYTFGPSFTTDNEFQQWRTFVLSIDLTVNKIFIGMDSEIFVETSTNLFTVGMNLLIFGSFTGTVYTSGYFDEIKLLDGALLPFGSYFTGNGLVNTDHAHSDILFYWDGSDCTSIPVSIGNVTGTLGGSGGTFQATGGIAGRDPGYWDTEGTAYLSFLVTNRDIFNPNSASISFWVRCPSLATTQFIFRFAGTGTNVITLQVDTAGQVRLRWVDTGTFDNLSRSGAIVANVWHHILCNIEADNSIQLVIDGIESTPTTLSESTTDVNGILSFCDQSNISDTHTDEVQITDKIGTPQIPVLLGSGPIHLPLVNSL